MSKRPSETLENINENLEEEILSENIKIAI